MVVKSNSRNLSRCFRRFLVVQYCRTPSSVGKGRKVYHNAVCHKDTEVGWKISQSTKGSLDHPDHPPSRVCIKERHPETNAYTKTQSCLLTSVFIFCMVGTT